MEEGIECLASGKAKDIEDLQAEHLKWGQEHFSDHIVKIMNQMMKEGFPER
jgi:hypothetical protein